MAFVRSTFLLIAFVFLAIPAWAENKYQKDWNRFLEKDKNNPPSIGAILAMGSSSLRMWTSLPQDMAPLPVLNRAFGGAVTQDTVEAAPLIVIPYKPKVILYYAGDNDLNKPNKDPRIAIDGFKQFLAVVRKELPQVRVVYLAIKPSPSRKECLPIQKAANAAIAELCKDDPLLTFVDVFSVLLDESGQPDETLFRKDKLHMERIGYERWIKVLKPVLEKVWGEVNNAK